MTREEAIARIKEHIVVHRMNEPRAIHITEALEMAIKALEQEPCEDCISRQAVLNEIPVLWNSNGDKDYCMETLRDFVTELQPVTSQPKTGHRIGIDEEPHEDWECDNCGFVIWADENIEEFHYCPNCGAKMVEPQESEGKE